MNKSEWFYIASITLQLSGAVLLLIRYCFVSVEKQLKELEKRESRVEKGILVLGKTQPTPYEYKESVWLNRIAFAYISSGYLVSVWGEIENSSRAKIFLVIIIMSTALTVFSVFVAKKISFEKKAN